MEHKYLVAIEIGSSKIKGAVGAIDETGILNVCAIEERNLVDCVRHGNIQNVEEVKACVAEIISALESRANIAPRKVTGVYVALGGRSMMSCKRDIEMTFDDETEITAEVIDRLLDESKLEVLEDKEIVDVVPMGFSVDNMAHQIPIGTYGHSLKASLNIIACRPQIVKNINRVIEERLQLDINGYKVRQVALSQLVLSAEEKKLGCVLVDFGAETTTVSIHKNDALQCLVTIPMGSRNITRDLTSLGITEESAERLKCQQANANSQETIGQGGKSTILENVDDAVFNNYVQYRAGEIAFNIASQIKQAGFKPADLTGGIVIVGQGAKLHGFNAVLEFHTSLKVRNGMISTMVHISDGRVLPGDALDVIAILLAASKGKGALDCLEGIVQERQVQPIAIEDSNDDEGDDSRIKSGFIDDDIIEDDDIEETPKKPVKQPKQPKQPSRAAQILGKIKVYVGEYLKEDSDGYDD